MSGHFACPEAKEFFMVSLFRPIRLMVLDDHALILQGISENVREERDITVLGYFTQSQKLIDALSQQEVDVVLMDYSLSPGEVDGLNLIRGLRIKFPKVSLLVISALHAPATVAMAMRCGAKGFLGKETAKEQLLIAIRRVASGRDYLHPMMENELRENQVSIAKESQEDLANPLGLNTLITSSELSVREREVLRCCLDGLSVTQIAQKFTRSVKTISTQKHSAYRKLGIRNDNELFKVRSQFEGW
jgi:DNA-binding NarL/FixJ family response regulator